MKKLLALILAGLMIFAFAACSDLAEEEKETNKPGESTETPEEEVKEPKLEGVEAPVDILTAVWGKYADDQKFFAMGGDFENLVENAPGAYALTDKESMAAQLVCKDSAVDMIDAAASLIHMMNANTFTGAAYSIKDGANADEFVKAMKDNIKNNQWICGFPEKLLVAKVTDDYVVVVYGAGELVDTFNTHLVEVYDFASVSVESVG